MSPTTIFSSSIEPENSPNFPPAYPAAAPATIVPATAHPIGFEAKKIPDNIEPSVPNTPAPIFLFLLLVSTLIDSYTSSIINSFEEKVVLRDLNEASKLFNISDIFFQ